MIAYCPRCGIPHVIMTMMTVCLRCGILFWSDGSFVETPEIIDSPKFPDPDVHTGYSWKKK